MKISSLIAIAASLAAGTAWSRDDAGGQPNLPAAFRSPLSYINLRAGLLYSDPVLFIPTSRSGDTAASAGFDIDYVRSGRKLDLDALGSLQWLDYLGHTYRSSVLGTVTANARWGQSSDWFQWLALDTFGQLSAAPAQPATPNTIENVNYFSTGPTVNIFFDPKTRLSVFGFYSNTTYERSPFDSHSLKEGAALIEGTAQSSFGLKGTTERTIVANPAVARDYQVNSVFGSYDADVGRTRVGAEVGYTQLRFAGHTTSGPLLNVRLERGISYSSSVYARVGSYYSGAQDALHPELVSGATVGSTIGTASPDPIKEREVELGWNFNRLRTIFSILGNLNRQRFVKATELDRNDARVEARLERRLSLSVSAIAQIRVEDERFVNVSTKILETTLSAGFSKRFDRLSLSVRYDWHHRTPSGQPLQTTGVLYGFTQNEIGVYLQYGLIGRH